MKKTHIDIILSATFGVVPTLLCKTCQNSVGSPKRIRGDYAEKDPVAQKARSEGNTAPQRQSWLLRTTGQPEAGHPRRMGEARPDCALFHHRSVCRLPGSALEIAGPASPPWPGQPALSAPRA